MANDQSQLASGSRDATLHLGRLERTLLLAAILLVGAYLRFTGSDWDADQWIHPDEGHMRIITSVIEMPDDPALYFDTHQSPLNCRNEGHRYSYGTLPLFITRMTAEWLDLSCGEEPGLVNGVVASLLLGPSAEQCNPGSFTGVYSARVGRMWAALADVGTVFLIYLIGRRLYGDGAGLLAAALGALTAFSIQQAHFFTVDSAACFFTSLTAYFAVRAGQSGNWGDFGLAGLTTGLAAACKVSAVFAALLVVLAAVWRLLPLLEFRRSVRSPENSATGTLVKLVLCLGLAGILSLVAFRVAQPYAFEGPGFLGMRPSPEWFDRLKQIRAEQSGEIDLPYGRQWTDRTPILFPWVNMTVWGMGLPLGLLAWVGWAVIGWELLRGNHSHLILWMWGTVIFLYRATGWVKAMRYLLDLYPLFAIFAAYLVVRICRIPSQRWRRAGFALAGLGVIGAGLWAGAVFSIYLRTNTRVAASRWIYANVPTGVTVANEHYDWGLPLRVDGKDPFGGMYYGIEMQHYNEDTPEKWVQLLDWLDQADYIFLASNRLYGSIPRLSARYPLTIEYYRALFAEELGFELAADFTSRPALGPFQFPDQENPFPLVEANYTQQRNPIKIALPPAEEAFSVYDHPRVLIFRKTNDYSRQLVKEVLGKADLDRAVHGLSPRQATAAPGLLEFDPETWAAQQTGGTWSGMFNRDSLLNQYPALAVVVWWVVVTMLGWLAFPLLFVTVPRLHDRGYGLARILGLLFIAYVTWLAASLRALPNTRGTIVRVVLLLALMGCGVGWFKREGLRRFVKLRWKLILLTEGLFVLLYLGWSMVRLLQPDLWHPAVGGEKPMDFAYLNAVIKSTWFPPYNPWFAGSMINYYYFGFVIVGTLIKLVGTVPAIAYNLVVPLLYALTGVGAFSVAYNLFGGPRRGARLAGVMGLVFTVVLGNLGVVRLIRISLIRLGGDPFPSTVPAFAETATMLRGLWQVVAHGAKLPVRTESWYWYPTRIIPAETGNPIAEFPVFTFLYGDLHAHMIAFCLTLLALALAVYWVRDRRPHWGSILIGGLVVGALWPTNTWDYPTYLVLGIVALAMGAFGGLRKSSVRDFVGRVVLLVGLSVFLYLPYFRHYAAGYTSVEKWEGLNTSGNIYLWIHTALLFPIAIRLLIEVRQNGTKVWNRLGIGLVLIAIGSAVLVLTSFTNGNEVALVTVPVGVLAACILIIPGMPATRRLLWFMVGSGMALGWAVETIVLQGDIGRQNTVFKFYLQAWILLSVTAGVSLAWVHERASRWKPEWRQLWWIGMGVLIFGGALFLPYGIRARAIDRISPQTGLTMDGMAFIEHSVVWDGEPSQGGQELSLNGDYHAIRWMQDNIQGSPVILEGLGYREYLWANRVSIYTGLPTVVGWRWHEVQQYAALPSQLVEWRRDDVRECYSTTNIDRAQRILARYGVRFIYVGDYERAYYHQEGIDKFDQMAAQGLLHMVYDAYGVKIYEVAGYWMQSLGDRSLSGNIGQAMEIDGAQER